MKFPISSLGLQLITLEVKSLVGMEIPLQYQRDSVKDMKRRCQLIDNIRDFRY